MFFQTCIYRYVKGTLFEGRGARSVIMQEYGITAINSDTRFGLCKNARMMPNYCFLVLLIAQKRLV
jgi:hypothetical protein